MYNILATVLTVLTAPIWLPFVIYLGVAYRWQDTVPENTVQEDTNDD